MSSESAMEAAGSDEWTALVRLSSVPLRNLNDDNLPLGGMASGCLIDYLGHRILLSVYHATGVGGRWAVEVGFDLERQRAKLLPVGGFNCIREFNLEDGTGRNVDFTYLSVPPDFKVYWQHLNARGECFEQRERLVFTPDFSVVPSKDEVYGFSGQVLGQFVPGANIFSAEHRTYLGLRFLRTEGGQHYFSIPNGHPGDEHFRGCSGAPILDTQGNIVALVCGGNVNSDEIHGVALCKYAVALDATFGGQE